MEEKNLIKPLKRVIQKKRQLIKKLGIKTKALWFAATIIQENLSKDKTVDEVYEMLKFVGKQNYENEKKGE